MRRARTVGVRIGGKRLAIPVVVICKDKLVNLKVNSNEMINDESM